MATLAENKYCTEKDDYVYKRRFFIASKGVGFLLQVREQVDP